MINPELIESCKKITTFSDSVLMDVIPPGYWIKVPSDLYTDLITRFSLEDYATIRTIDSPLFKFEIKLNESWIELQCLSSEAIQRPVESIDPTIDYPVKLSTNPQISTVYQEKALSMEPTQITSIYEEIPPDAYGAGDDAAAGDTPGGEFDSTGDLMVIDDDMSTIISLQGRIINFLLKIYDFDALDLATSNFINIIPEDSPLNANITETQIDSYIAQQTDIDTHLQKYAQLDQTLAQQITQTQLQIQQLQPPTFLNKIGKIPVSILGGTVIITTIGWLSRLNFFPSVFRKGIVPLIQYPIQFFRSYRLSAAATKTVITVPTVIITTDKIYSVNQAITKLYDFGLSIDYTYFDTAYQVFNTFIDF